MPPTTSALGFDNFFQATLTGDITASSTDILMDNIPNATQGFLVIEPDSTTNREIIFYTSKTALKVTCPSAATGRGIGGTTATSHATGATVIMAPVAEMFEALQDGSASTDPLRGTLFFDHVASGCVWTGDAYGSTRNASMTSGVVYIGGAKVTVSSISARTFTASRDTYIDVGTDGVVDYNEVTNNAASPALAASHVRLGIIVTGASNIANVGSVNQGEENKVLPIVSSVAYTVTDSLGNLICPRDPARKVLGYRQITATFSTSTTGSDVDITGLSVPVLVPENRKIKITHKAGWVENTVANANVISRIKESSTVLSSEHGNYAAVTARQPRMPICQISPTAGLHTYKATVQGSSGTTSLYATSDSPFFILVELV